MLRWVDEYKSPLCGFGGVEQRWGQCCCVSPLECKHYESITWATWPPESATVPGKNLGWACDVLELEAMKLQEQKVSCLSFMG